jgi:hypothetical protein
MKVGDTFLWFLGGRKEHLYIVLTDPNQNDGKFVAVNITKSTHGEKSFTLRAGDHPYIVTDSDVNFGDAIIIALHKYEHFVKWEQAIPREPMDIEIVEEIAKAFIDHPAPSGEAIGLVQRQWKK